MARLTYVPRPPLSDQAHFIHDFRAFSGINPTAYVRVRGPQRNHIPLAG